MRKLSFWLSVIILCFSIMPQAQAQTGFHMNSDCSNLKNPVNDQTVCAQTTTASSRSPGLYVFTASAWSLIAGTSADTFDAVADRGSTTSGRNSFVNSLRVYGDNANSGHSFYDDVSLGPIQAPFCGGVENDCDKKVKLNSGKIWCVTDASGNCLLQVAQTGAVTFANNGKPTKAFLVQAKSLREDAAQCVISDHTLGSGPSLLTMRCADSASGTFQWDIDFFGQKWDGGALTIYIRGTHGTTETITWASDVKAQCRSIADAVNNTWSSTVNVDVAITTANIRATSSGVSLTPNGTCAADDKVYFHATIDNTTMSANAANFDVEEIIVAFVTTGP